MPGLIPGGMPTVTLSDAAALRLETISFFLVAFLLAAWGVKGLWNLLRRDWPALPRLSYPAALGMTGLWGLLFVLVLTMIAGTRELLTPGAWEKRGVTYRLKKGEERVPPVSDATAEDRERRLRDLGRALLAFAATHEGRFPHRDETDEIDDALWRLPNRPASNYRYVPGATADGKGGKQVVAYEPMLFDSGQLVLLSDGTVEAMTPEALAEALPPEEVAERVKVRNRKDDSFMEP
ncbi:MAG TPA: hypothetical protein VF170_12900 [Planctomycetaceae bacterium]